MRYSRQEILKQIGKLGQEKISNTRVCIVGVGALGTVAAELLVRAGVSKLILIDRDFIELHNLQRQTLFDESDVGLPKAICAKKHLEKINSTIEIDAYVTDLDYKNIEIIKSDLVLGCTDNLESRFLIDEYCHKNNLPWVYGAAIGTKGFIFNVMPKHVPFKSIFSKATNLGTCDTVGILNTNSTMIGTMIANEAIKIIIGNDYEKNLIYIDSWKNIFEKIKINKDHNYIQKYEYMEGGKKEHITKLCGNGIYQIKDKKIDYIKLKNNMKEKKGFIDSGVCFHFEKFTVFNDGRVFVKSSDEKKAKIMYDKFIGN